MASDSLRVALMTYEANTSDAAAMPICVPEGCSSSHSEHGSNTRPMETMVIDR